MQPQRSRRNITFIGELAEALAMLSRRYVRTFCRQVQHITNRIYEAYRRFEILLATAITDFVLFLWALRSFVLIIGIEVALIVAAIRWPLLWAAVVILTTLLVTAAMELSRGGLDALDDERSDDPIRDAVYRVVLFLQRGALLLIGLSITVLFALQRYEQSNLSTVADAAPSPVITSAAVPPETPILSAATTTTRTRRSGSDAVTSRQVNLKNDCKSKTISIAVHYRDKTNNWVTRGWYILKPETHLDNVATTIGPRVYFYGKSGDSKWVPVGDEPRKQLRVRDGKFRAISNKLSGEDVRKIMFFGVDSPAGSAHTQSFTCSTDNDRLTSR